MKITGPLRIAYNSLLTAKLRFFFDGTRYYYRCSRCDNGNGYWRERTGLGVVAG